MSCRSAENTILFNELDSQIRKMYFEFSRQKFIHNIDSLYYVVKVKNDWNKDSNCRSLVETLELKKSVAIRNLDPILPFQNDSKRMQFDFTMNGIGSKPYLYDLEKKDKYIVFILNHKLNASTPELWVQIRSQALWLQGEYNIVGESIKDVSEFLATYDIEIEEI